MCNPCVKIPMHPHLLSIEEMILGLQNQPEESTVDCTAKSIEEKIFGISPACYNDPSSIELIQKLVLLFICKIRNSSDGERVHLSIKSLLPFSQMRFIQFPTELIEATFLRVSSSNLLKLRSVCKRFKLLIETRSKLQSQIDYHFLQIARPKCSISSDELKLDLTQNKLSLEITNNLCLWKLLHVDYFGKQLTKTLPSICHLSIKNGKPKELTELFIKLCESRQLLTLFLLGCEVDAEALKALKGLQHPTHQDRRTPVFYFSDLKCLDGILPEEFTTPSFKINLIDPRRTSEYSIERFSTIETDVIALKELEQQIQQESSTGELILKKIHELKPAILAEIVNSVWHNKLMQSTETAPSTKLIRKQVWSFIEENPHHPALKAAIKRNLLYFQINP